MFTQNTICVKHTFFELEKRFYVFWSNIEVNLLIRGGLINKNFPHTPRLSYIGQSPPVLFVILFVSTSRYDYKSVMKATYGQDSWEHQTSGDISAQETASVSASLRSINYSRSAVNSKCPTPSTECSSSFCLRSLP